MGKGKYCSVKRIDLGVEHRGFSIVKEITTYYRWSSFTHEYTDYPERTTKNYTFCEVGYFSSLTDKNDYMVCANTKDDACKLIDDMLDNDEIILTHGEFREWATKPAQKAGYGWSYNQLMKILKAYKKADRRRKVGYQEMLTDANYHSFCALLHKEDYEGFEKLAYEELTWRERFEVNVEFMGGDASNVDIDGVKEYLEECMKHYKPKRLNAKASVRHMRE